MHGPTRDEQELLERAWQAARQAYARYSGFHVGAALRTLAGGVFAGCNIENASYGLTMCAERNAVAAAVAAEGPAMRIATIVCVVDADQPFAPCGACRQVIAEFAAPDAVVLYQDRTGPVTRATVGALLPRGFSL